MKNNKKINWDYWLEKYYFMPLVEFTDLVVDYAGFIIAGILGAVLSLMMIGQIEKTFFVRLSDLLFYVFIALYLFKHFIRAVLKSILDKKWKPYNEFMGKAIFILILFILGISRKHKEIIIVATVLVLIMLGYFLYRVYKNKHTLSKETTDKLEFYIYRDGKKIRV